MNFNDDGPTITSHMAFERRNVKRIILVGAIVTAAYIWVFGWSTAMVILARRLGRKSPEVYVVPSPLPDTSISQRRVKKFVVGEYEFESPWTDLEPVKNKTPKQWLALQSPSKMGVLIMGSKPNQTIELLRGKSPEAENVFGSLGSDYEFHKRMLETTPTKVKLLSKRKEAVNQLSLLVLKQTIVPVSANSVIYSVQSPEFKGFQFGDPNKRSGRAITVDLYSDDANFELVFSEGASASIWRQSDINRVVQSLHKKSN